MIIKSKIYMKLKDLKNIEEIPLDKFISGIYILCLDDIVKYVGQSVCVLL